MKTMQQEFNEYCADVMGYYKSAGIYFTPIGIAIAKYDPWNDDEQLTNVACVLADFGKLPHNLDVRMSSIQVSIAEVRDYVRKNLMEESREASVVLNDIRRRKAEDEAKSEEFKMNQFNEHCANIMGWERRGNMHYDGEGKCIGDVSFYNPYESSGDLQAVLDVLRVLYGLVPTGSSSHAGRDLVWWYVVYGDECPKVEGTVNKEVIKGCVGKERFWEEERSYHDDESGMGHPYERCAEMESGESLTVVEAIRADFKKRQEEDRRKEFNAKSAEIMGWHLGEDELIGDIYFDDFGNVASHVNRWNPYELMEQMQCVLNVANEKYGVSIYPHEIFEKPMLDVGRDKIFGASLSQESQGDVLDIEEGWDEHDRLHPINFDTIGGIPFTVESCCSTGAGHGGVNNLEDVQVLRFNQFCAEITNSRISCGYDPYNNLDQLEEAIIVIGDDLRVFVDEWLEAARGRLVACRAVVNEVMPDDDDDLSEADDWTILGEDLGNDVHDACKKISDAIGSVVGTDSTYPNVKEEQDNFNTQCRKIMFKHSKNQGGSLMLTNDFDPYYNGTQLINVLEVVLQYIPNSICCMIAAGQKDANPDEVTHGLDVTWHMRKFIESYGTDEWMTVPLGIEETFNVMCKKLCEGYNIMPTDENYNPYDYIGDLAPILPVIIRRVDEPFAIPDIMSDMPGEHRYNCDIHDNMVHYVSRHGETVLGFLEYDEE